jgi:hypothetical protein
MRLEPTACFENELDLQYILLAAGYIIYRNTVTKGNGIGVYKVKAGCPVERRGYSAIEHVC